MKKFANRFMIILFIFQCSSFANKLNGQQQTLWLMSGEKIEIQSYLIDSTVGSSYQILYVNLKGKQKSLFTDEVFSYTGMDSKERIFYQPQLELGETLSVPEMRDFITGLSDAKMHRITPWLFVGGGVFGLTGAFVPSPEIEFDESSMSVPVGILIPTAYVGFSGMLSPGADKLKDKTPNPNPTEPYLMGYQEGVKKKIIKNSLLSAGVGFIAGFIIVVAAN